MINSDRFKGCLYGQAIGDALGLGAEGMLKKDVERTYPEGLSRYDQIVRDAYRRRWQPGEWTDDTDMMLCIARALIARKGVVDDETLRAIARNFKTWVDNPEARGIGQLVRTVLQIGNYTEHPREVARLSWEISRRRNAPNGAIMRTSVVGLLPEKVAESAEAICQLTHYDPRCVGSSVIVSEIIHHLIYNNQSLTPGDIKTIAKHYDNRILPFIDLAETSSDIASLQLDEEGCMAYTLKTLSAALWCYFHSGSFKEGLLTVVNAAGDADTNAAVACALLGARFGLPAIPAYYTDNLYRKAYFDGIVEELLQAVVIAPNAVG